MPLASAQGGQEAPVSQVPLPPPDCQVWEASVGSCADGGSLGTQESRCAGSGEWGGGPFAQSQSRHPLSSQQSLEESPPPSRGVCTQLVPRTRQCQCVVKGMSLFRHLSLC